MADWVVEFLDDGVRAQFRELPLEMRARFERIAQLIRSDGLEKVREPTLSICRDRFGRCAYPAGAELPERCM